MPKEPSQPKKSIFDHPEISEINSVEKIKLIAEMLTMNGVFWDGGIWVMPTSTTNLSKMKQWMATCEKEGLGIKDITGEMDPNNATPMRKYFVSKERD